MHILHCFVQLYFDHFHPLWTLIWQQYLDFDAISPHLYLTLSSIGAMYAGKRAGMYGSMMHERLRSAFMTTPMWFQETDDASEALCQAILLVQVSALYFGQKKAFSCAQQLGCILISQCRKINLFSDDFAHVSVRDGQIDQQVLINCRIRAETRRRLAFGTFRADIFLSVLLNTRPLISYEEMNMEMPCAAALWRYDAHDLQQYLRESEINQKSKRRMLFSDLVRIAMDRSEPLPGLNPAESELLLFALQHSVWQFSHDPNIFQRLTGNEIFDSSSLSPFQNDFFDREPAPSRPLADNLGHSHMTSNSSRDHLDCSIRPMTDLKADYARTLSALRKWKSSYSAAFTSAQLTADRSVLISSRLLYHLSFIRLKADVEIFHLISYAPAALQKHESIANVYAWSTTKNAQDALSHACAIWSLVSQETSRNESSRARFNILAFISLHHAASVVWAYAGTHPSPSRAALETADPTAPGVSEDLRIYRDNNHALLTSFTKLLQKVSPAWIAMSAFSATTGAMARRTFPVLE
jgi:hypothetical protein